jgi:hypothetical protein
MADFDAEEALLLAYERRLVCWEEQEKGKQLLPAA